MNQQQLNKIDEEFEKRFTNPNKLDSRSFLHPYYQNGKIGLLLTDFKTFLHSKLQEAYELGKRDEREDIVEMVSNTHFRPPTISGGEEISPREILTNAAGWMNCHQQIINKIKEM